MLAAYTRLARPFQAGTIALAWKGISECLPLPTHHRPRPMIAAVGMAVPIITPTPVQRADFRDPNSDESVTAQKITSMTGTRNALFCDRFGLITYAAVVARNTSTGGTTRCSPTSRTTRPGSPTENRMPPAPTGRSEEH